MKMKLRLFHRLVSVWIALPLLVIVSTGLVLILRQKIEIIQPQGVKMERFLDRPLLSFEEIMRSSGVESQEIDQIIFKPHKFHLALRLKDGREMQMHPQTGEILKVAPRLTGLLIDLHQGSFFGTWAQYGVFFPTGLGLLFLLISGLLIYPRRKRREE